MAKAFDITTAEEVNGDQVTAVIRITMSRDEWVRRCKSPNKTVMSVLASQARRHIYSFASKIAVEANANRPKIDKPVELCDVCGINPGLFTSENRTGAGTQVTRYCSDCGSSRLDFVKKRTATTGATYEDTTGDSDNNGE